MEKDLSISYAKATILGILFPLPLSFVIVEAFTYYWGSASLLAFIESKSLYISLIVFIIVGSIFHEAIHGLTWAYFGNKPIRSIRYGIHWKSLSPYAHCPEPIEIGAYRIGGVMPFIVEGFFPSLIGLITGSVGLIFFGLIFTLGAGGDLLILWIIRSVKHGALIQDHPTRVGCSIVIPDDPPDGKDIENS
jgi:hypothetical protein